MFTFSLFGALFAVVFYAISVSPSLLPRRWWWHAFVSGTLMGLGYALGMAISSLVNYVFAITGTSLSAPEKTVEVATYALVIAVVIWATRAVIGSFWASKRAAALTGMKPIKFPEYLLGMSLSLVMFALVLAVLQFLLWVFSLIVRFLDRWLFHPLSVLIAIAAVLVLIFVVSNKVVFKAIMAYFSYTAGKMNDSSSRKFAPPTVPERSASPQSLSTWESVGGQGRTFLTLGPGVAEIEEITGRSGMEPIRVYAGIDGPHPDLQASAKQAVAELKRAGGLERAVVIVYTATGSGWVDQWLIQPAEYLTGGNCATVSMQYSYLFSAALLVSDLETCAHAGVALFEAVEEAVNELPRDKRPLVLVAGESLGAYGSQAPFRDLEDLNRRTDGAIWVGSPQGSRLSQLLTNERHRGSPQVAPVVGSARHARFVNNPQLLSQDLFGRELGPWDFPRSVFVQHASDPVVWYTPRLMIEEPDWLRERVGLDVSRSMRYTPIATYLQVMTDLPIAGMAPPGHGHTYHRELIEVWIRVLGFDQGQAFGRVGDTAWVTKEMKDRIGTAIEHDQLRVVRATDLQRAARTQE